MSDPNWRKTQSGRVVYDRKANVFLPADVRRIVMRSRIGFFWVLAVNWGRIKGALTDLLQDGLGLPVMLEPSFDLQVKSILIEDSNSGGRYDLTDLDSLFSYDVFIIVKERSS